MPRVDTVLALAATHELSIDWLVGLSNVGPLEAELLPHTSFEAPGPSPTDERLLGWLDEAAGSKIRYVPATLPDLLKTDAVIRFERSRAGGPNAAQTIDTIAARLDVGAEPGQRDGVLLVRAGAAVLRPWRGHLEPAREPEPGASNSTA